jgi:hypothetical protein
MLGWISLLLALRDVLRGRTSLVANEEKRTWRSSRHADGLADARPDKAHELKSPGRGPGVAIMTRDADEKSLGDLQVFRGRLPAIFHEVIFHDLIFIEG